MGHWGVLGFPILKLLELRLRQLLDVGPHPTPSEAKALPFASLTLYLFGRKPRLLFHFTQENLNGALSPLSFDTSPSGPCIFLLYFVPFLFLSVSALKAAQSTFGSASSAPITGRLTMPKVADLGHLSAANERHASLAAPPVVFN